MNSSNITTKKLKGNLYEHTMSFPVFDPSILKWIIKCLVAPVGSSQTCENPAIGNVELKDYIFDGESLSPSPAYYCDTPICEKHLSKLLNLFEELENSENLRNLNLTQSKTIKEK